MEDELEEESSDHSTGNTDAVQHNVAGTSKEKVRLDKPKALEGKRKKPSKAKTVKTSKRRSTMRIIETDDPDEADDFLDSETQKVMKQQMEDMDENS